MVEILSIEALLNKKLAIPNYQRPYKWTNKNMSDLLEDINIAIADSVRFPNFKYRIGTVILHEEDGILNIVDGQQRIISLLLLRSYLEPTFSCDLLQRKFDDKESQKNIHRNALFVKDWFSLKGKDYCNKALDAFASVLEAVVITVDKIHEAFQLFDSQNTRGKALDPHDLLKAYHLRAMREEPYEMQHAVTKWEAVNTKAIRELFDLYLFPIWNWSRREKTSSFTAKEIDTYKGIPENSNYTYAKRAKKAMPYFQLTEPIIEGGDFFEMVEHYLELLSDVKKEIASNEHFETISAILNSYGSAGFNYAKNLFYCAAMCYYDKFHNFDEQALKKLFSWALMLRVDLENLGYDSVNKYAVGDYVDRYSNVIPVFSIICNARVHTEISNLQIKVIRSSGHAQVGKWEPLYEQLLVLNGIKEANANGQ